MTQKVIWIFARGNTTWYFAPIDRATISFSFAPKFQPRLLYRTWLRWSATRSCSPDFHSRLNSPHAILAPLSYLECCHPLFMLGWGSLTVVRSFGVRRYSPCGWLPLWLPFCFFSLTRSRPKRTSASSPSHEGRREALEIFGPHCERRTVRKLANVLSWELILRAAGLWTTVCSAWGRCCWTIRTINHGMWRVKEKSFIEGKVSDAIRIVIKNHGQILLTVFCSIERLKVWAGFGIFQTDLKYSCECVIRNDAYYILTK